MLRILMIISGLCLFLSCDDGPSAQTHGLGEELLPIALILIVFMLLVRIHDKKKEREEDEMRRIRLRKKEESRVKRELEFNEQRNKIISQYGDITCDINLTEYEYDRYDIACRVMICESSQVVIIQAKEYKFSDILGFSLVDDATSETFTTSSGTATTSTGSMLGRAVIGGVLTGGLGAVTGAATAKKDIMDNASSQTTTTHNYTLYINVNSLQEPTIALAIGKDTSKAQKLAGLLNIIIERNNIQKQ